jgi:hypothetical protein
MKIGYTFRRECVRFGPEGGRNGEWRCSCRWARIAAGTSFERAPENIELWQQDGMERFSGVVFENQIVNVSHGHFRWITRVYRPVLRHYSIRP